jgi:hypothetical protein
MICEPAGPRPRSPPWQVRFLLVQFLVDFEGRQAAVERQLADPRVVRDRVRLFEDFYALSVDYDPPA